MMTQAEIRAEIERMTGTQRAALRARFCGKPISYLRCKEFLGSIRYVHVIFQDGLEYDIAIGKRGALQRVTCLGRVGA